MFSSTPGTRDGDAQASRFYEHAAGKIELSHVVTLKPHKESANGRTRDNSRGSTSDARRDARAGPV